MHEKTFLDKAREMYDSYRRVTIENNLFTPRSSFRTQLPCGSEGFIRDAWKEALAYPPFRDNIGLYIHIPFCSDSRCSYCMYSSNTVHTERDRSAYIDYLTSLAEYFSPTFSGISLGSLYIGGGTPSLLNISLLERLYAEVISRFSFIELAEKTCELSFLTASHDKLSFLRTVGINRLSFGLQSIEPLVLTTVNRKEVHLSLVSEMIAECQSLGFSEVNMDLMVGLPQETINGICAGFRAAVQSGANVVTVYVYRHRAIKDVDLIDYNNAYVPSVLRALRQSAREVGWIDTVCDDNPEYQFFTTQKHLDSYALNAYQTRYDPARLNSVLGMGHTAFSFIGDFFRSECRDETFSFNPASPTNAYDLLPYGHRCRIYVIEQLYREGSVDLADYEQRFGNTFFDAFDKELALLDALGAIQSATRQFSLKANDRLDFAALTKFFWDQDLLNSF